MGLQFAKMDLLHFKRIYLNIRAGIPHKNKPWKKEFPDFPWHFPWHGHKFPWSFSAFCNTFYLEHEMIIATFFRWKSWYIFFQDNQHLKKRFLTFWRNKKVNRLSLTTTLIQVLTDFPGTLYSSYFVFSFKHLLDQCVIKPHIGGCACWACWDPREWFSYQWLLITTRVLARILKWGVQNTILHKNEVSNSYPSNSKIPNLRVSKITKGCPKDGGQVSS